MHGVDVMVGANVSVGEGFDYMKLISSGLNAAGGALTGDDEKKAKERAEAKKKAEEEAKKAKEKATLHRNLAIAGVVTALAYYFFIYRKKQVA